MFFEAQGRGVSCLKWFLNCNNQEPRNKQIPRNKFQRENKNESVPTPFWDASVWILLAGNFKIVLDLHLVIWDFSG